MPSASEDAYVRKTGEFAGKTVWRGFAIRPDGTRETKGPFSSQRKALAWATIREQEIPGELAAAALAAIEQQSAAEAAEAAEAARCPTLSQWWEHVQAHDLWPTSELNRDQRDRDLLLFALHRYGDVPMDAIRPAEVTLWLRRLTVAPTPEDRDPGRWRAGAGETEGSPRPLRPCSVGTARRAYSALHRLCQLAVKHEEGRLKINLITAAELPESTGDGPLRYPQPAAVRDAVALLPERLVAVARLAALSGLRLGELRALDTDTWKPGQDGLLVNKVVIEPQAGQFAARPATKGKRARFVPLVPEVVAALEKHIQRWPPVPVKLRQTDDDGRPTSGTTTRTLLFTDEQGRPLLRAALLKAWLRAQEQAGVPLVPWHGLRHHYATTLLFAGESLQSVAGLMGHSVSTTTDLYSGVVQQHTTARERLSAAATELGWGDQVAARRAAEREAARERLNDEINTFIGWDPDADDEGYPEGETAPAPEPNPDPFS